MCVCVPISMSSTFLGVPPPGLNSKLVNRLLGALGCVGRYFPMEVAAAGQAVSGGHKSSRGYPRIL